MSYLGIGNETPNHPVEINGDLFISNVSIPFEIYSDYTGEGSLTDSRQIRLRVTPSETITSNSHIDMGIDNTTSDFFISNPVFDSTISGNKNSFKINSQGDVTFLSSNVTCENNISSEQIYLHTLSIDLVKNDIDLLGNKIKINGTLSAEATAVIPADIKANYLGSAMLSTYGDIYATGFLVNNPSTFTKVVPASEDDKFVKIAKSAKSIFAIKTDGTLWGMTTINQASHLGIGTSINPYFGQLVQCSTTYSMPITNVVDVRVGNDTVTLEDYTIVLKDDGSVWGCGPNDDGQFGNDTTSITYFFTPSIGAGSENVSNITTQNASTMIIKNDGSVWGTGRNNNGELGIGDSNGRTTFTQALESGSIPVSNAQQIELTWSNSFLLKTNNNLYYTSSNEFTQMSGTTSTNVSSIVPSTSRTQLGIIRNGAVYLLESGYATWFALPGEGSSDVELASIDGLYPYDYSVSVMIIKNDILFGWGLQSNYNMGITALGPGTNSTSVFLDVPLDTPETRTNINLSVTDVNYGTKIYPGITIGDQILRSSGYGIFLGDNQNYVSLDSSGVLEADAFISFTGAHIGNKSNYIEPGMIVSVDPSIKLCINSVNSVVPYIKKSNINNDENVCGVCSDELYFNGVGEGAVWVCDAGGAFSSGDYITSCYISGYGKKQEDIYMQNYTVGKILENCDFTGSGVRYLSISDDNSVTIIDESQYLAETRSVYKAQLVACTYHCG